MARHSKDDPAEAETTQIPVDVDEVSPHSGPLSLKHGMAYQPMYRGGANPHHDPPDKRWTAAEREMAALPTYEPTRSAGLTALVFVSVGLAIGAMGLALWMYLRGNDCPTPVRPQQLTPTVTETVTPPAGPT